MKSSYIYLSLRLACVGMLVTLGLASFIAFTVGANVSDVMGDFVVGTGMVTLSVSVASFLILENKKKRTVPAIAFVAVMALLAAYYGINTWIA